VYNKFVGASIARASSKKCPNERGDIAFAVSPEKQNQGGVTNE